MSTSRPPSHEVNPKSWFFRNLILRANSSGGKEPFPPSDVLPRKGFSTVTKRFEGFPYRSVPALLFPSLTTPPASPKQSSPRATWSCRCVMNSWTRTNLSSLGHDFTDLFPEVGQPAAAPARLALVLILQFMEGLTAGKRPTLFEPGSTESTSLAFLSPTSASITPSSVSQSSRLLDHGAERSLSVVSEQKGRTKKRR